MAYEVDITTVEPIQIAAVWVRATLAQLSDVIPAALARVRAAMKDRADLLGRNVTYYPDGMALMSDAGSLIECGVEAPTPIVGTDDIIAVHTPAGRVAHLVYWGPYAQLSAAHKSVHAYCAAGGHKITGVNWEVYGDRNKDPSKQRTDIYYQLA